MNEADKCFNMGINQEETKGIVRAALVSFVEAATLYEGCINYLGESSTEELVLECKVKLAYICIRLAHINHDALSFSKAANRLYQDAVQIDPTPSCVAYDGIGTTFEAMGRDLSKAIDAYERGLKLYPNNLETNFHLSVALDRIGKKEEADIIFDKLRASSRRYSCLVDSWEYVKENLKEDKTEVILHRGTNSMLHLGIEAASELIYKDNGLVCEFGVATGRSLRMLYDKLPLSVHIHAFDTFTGLPMAWDNEPAGTYSTDGVIPNIDKNVIIHQGLFHDTIPNFLSNIQDAQPLAFVNVDCDLYSSTCDIFDTLHDRIVPGSVIVFDEYICHPTWREDECRAWKDSCSKYGWSYEYLGFSLSTKQAVVQVKSTDLSQTNNDFQ